MRRALRSRFGRRLHLLLLLLLILLILSYPLLVVGVARRIALAGLMLLTLGTATAAVARRERRPWPEVILLGGGIVFGVAAELTSHRAFVATQWAILTVFFAVIVGRLLTHLQTVRTITRGQLYTAGSAYLLLAMFFFALYNLIEALSPGSFLHGGAPLSEPQGSLLYFSLVTLTTVGYGDIVPAGGFTRMVAALEAATGVLYAAITIAVLVGSHKRHDK